MDARPRRIQVDISRYAIFKVLAVAVGLFLFLRLAPILMLLFLSVLIAVALDPLVQWGERFLPRRLSVMVMALGFGAILVFFVLTVAPILIEQVSLVVEKLPSFVKTLMARSAPNGTFYRIGEKILREPDLPDLSTSLGQLVSVGQFAVGGISSLCLIFAFVVYLLLDGRRLYRWILVFFSSATRGKIEMTVPQVSHMISVYVIGQGLASMFCGIYVYGVTSLFGVPAAVMLAVIAAVCDVLPIVGFYIGLVPIAIFALAVSPTAMAAVMGAYWGYHLLEGYFILPTIYSKRLRLSGFAVLIAILAGLSVAGVLGAIAILPIVASYPVVERIWLSRFLGREVIAQHDYMTDVDL